MSILVSSNVNHSELFAILLGAIWRDIHRFALRTQGIKKGDWKSLVIEKLGRRVLGSFGDGMGTRYVYIYIHIYIYTVCVCIIFCWLSSIMFTRGFKAVQVPRQGRERTSNSAAWVVWEWVVVVVHFSSQVPLFPWRQRSGMKTFRW